MKIDFIYLDSKFSIEPFFNLGNSTWYYFWLLYFLSVLIHPILTNTKCYSNVKYGFPWHTWSNVIFYIEQYLKKTKSAFSHAKISFSWNFQSSNRKWLQYALISFTIFIYSSCWKPCPKRYKVLNQSIWVSNFDHIFGEITWPR